MPKPVLENFHVDNPDAAIMKEGEVHYEVERIEDSRIVTRQRKKVLEYHIKWKHHEDRTWEPEDACPLVSIKEFHKRYPEKPRLEK